MLDKNWKIASVLMGVVAVATTPVVYAKSKVLDERLSKLERTVKARGELQISMAGDVEALQDELNELRGVSEEHSHKLDQILKRQRDIYQELERRMGQLMERTSQVAQSVSDNPELGQTSSTADSSPAVELAADENQAYKRAVNLVLKDKRYDQAIPEFKAFIGQFPESSYVPNAHYWLGQLLFNKGDLAAATENFETVVVQYPDSNKRSDSLLKLGMVAQKQNDTEKAKKQYQQLLEEYPDSSAARLATGRLQSL